MASFRLPDGLLLTGAILKDTKRVAAGGYADIHIGQYRGRCVALKTMHDFQKQKTEEVSKVLKVSSATAGLCTLVAHSSLLQMFCREITLLHSLNHPNICGFIGVDRELFEGRFCLVTEWMPYGNIMDFIATNSFVLGEVKQFVSVLMFTSRCTTSDQGAGNRDSFSLSISTRQERGAWRLARGMSLSPLVHEVLTSTILEKYSHRHWSSCPSGRFWTFGLL